MDKLSYKSLLIIVTVLLIGIVFLLRIQKKGTAVLADWWNDSWNYRQTINVTAHTSAETNVYIIATVNIGTTTKSQPDNGDFRFTDQFGNLLSYYISANTGTTAPTFHIQIPSFPAGAQTFYAYYGNATADNGFSTSDFSTQATSYTVGSYGTEEAGGGPIAWWKFDENSGNVAKDSSGNGYNGSLNSGTLRQVPGKVGNAFQTANSDGVADSILVGDIANLDFTNTQNFTISSWIKHIAKENSNYFIYYKGAESLSNAGYNFGVNSSTKYECNYNDGNGSGEDSATSTTIATNEWHNVSCVMDRTGTATGTIGFHIFVDGRLEGSDTSLTEGSSINSNDIQIGETDTGYEMAVGIDELKIFNYARSLNQIKTEANSNSGLLISDQTSGKLSEGLVGYWKMDESVGPSLDSSGNGTTGTWSGNTSGVTGKYDIGASFDGTGDYINFGNPSVLNNLPAITISTWIKPNNDSGRIIDKQLNDSTTGWRAEIGSDGDLQFAVDYDGTDLQVDTNSSLSAGIWHHVVISWNGGADSSGVKIYADGVLQSFVGSTSATGNRVDDSTRSVGIGCRVSGANVCTSGVMDEIRLYNRELSPNEVQQLYQYAPGPSGWWKLDENNGTTAYDSSGNGYTGTLTNSPTWKTGKYGSGINTKSASAYINVGDPADGGLDFDTSDDFTISAWIRTSDPLSDNAEILYKGFGGSDPGYRFRLASSTGYFNCEIADNAAGTTQLSSNGPALNDGQWHYVTCVLSASGTQLSVYVDGIQRNTVADSEGPLLSAKNLEIGRNSATSYFPGDIDDVRIYRYALNASQIQADMNSGDKNNPIVHYKFEENNGTVVHDSSSNRLDLTLSSANWNSNGKFGTAWNGSGNNWASLTDASSGHILDFAASEDFSISLWFKSDSTTNPATTEYILSKAESSPGYRIYVDNTSNGDIYFAIDDDTSWTPGDKAGVAGRDYYDSNWHHLVGVKTGTSKIELYMDGLLVNSKIGLGETGTLENSANLYIGDRNGVDGGDEFNGDIDEVKIFNQALTPDQIKTLFNNSSSVVFGQSNQTIGATTTSLKYCIPGDTSPCNPPVGEWLFEQGTGTTANDTSNNSGDAGLLGSMDQSNWVIGKHGNGISFNGSTNYASITDNGLFESNDFTLETWIKFISHPSTTGEDCTLSVKAHPSSPWYSHVWTVNNTGQIQLDWVNTVPTHFYSASNALVTGTNQWYHLVTLKSGSTAAHYINGVLQTNFSDSMSGTTYNSTAALWLGAQGAGAQARCKAIIDDFKIYNYVRTPSQIAYDYNQGNPTAWWKLDECQGSTAFNSANVGDTGTITIGVGGSQSSLGTCSIGATTAWSQGSVGKFNSSLNFDGTDDRLNIYSVGMTNTFNPRQGSASLWLKMTPAAWADTSSTRAALWIAADTSNYIRIIKTTTANELIVNYVAGSTAKGLTFQTTDNTNWMHVVLTWDKPNDRVKVYINGKLSNTSTSLGTWTGAIASTRANIGARLSDGTDPFKGLIDDVRLYNYPLTNTQVLEIMNNGNFTLK